MTDTNPIVPPPNPKKESKPRDPIYITIILLLLIGGGLLYWEMSRRGEELSTCNTNNEMLQKDSDMLRSAMNEMGGDPESFLTDLNKLLVDYDTLISISSDLKQENTAMQDSLAVKRDQILSLQEEVKSGKWTAYQLFQKKKELDVLRGVMRDYVHRIDSLTTENKIIRDRLNKAEGQLTVAEETIGKYEVKTDALTEKVKAGQALKTAGAGAITYKLVRGTEKESNRARKVDRVKTCFTIIGNPIAVAGNKLIYMRVIDPNAKVVGTGATFSMGSANGQYSVAREVNYQNKDLPVCVTYVFDEANVPVKGTYNVELWVDGVKVGTTNFDLK